MLAAHYGTAMIAYQKYPKGTLLYFLFASQLQDFLWFSFHYLGLEVTTPDDVFDTTVSNMAVDMLYSHDLIPLFAWLLIIFLIGKFIFKETKIGLAGAILVLGHFALDFFSGHPHHIFGIDSHQVGLGNYASNVFLAIGVEVVATILILWYFFRQESKLKIKRTRKNRNSIIGLFIFGILFMLSIAIIPFREIFSIPEFDLGFNTSVPTLIITYIGMLLYLNYFVPKYSKGA
ncbi:MAG: hypothetical protein AB8G15_02465 [Saprospiraceae bacterium]